jgi:hypothetical protein
MSALYPPWDRARAHRTPALADPQKGTDERHMECSIWCGGYPAKETEGVKGIMTGHSEALPPAKLHQAASERCYVRGPLPTYVDNAPSTHVAEGELPSMVARHWP